MPRSVFSRPLLAAIAVSASLFAACDPQAPKAPDQVATAPVDASPLATTAASAPPASPAPSALPQAKYAAPAPPDPPIELHAGGDRAVSGRAGAVSTVEPNATRVGAEILARGGNAIDAAVAIAYVLAVTHPSAGNIGGGGFMLVRLASGETHAIDFREMAPAAATTERVLKMVKDDEAVGYRSPAVPGSVAGLNYAREKYGSLPLAELVAPAAALAKKGHRLGARQALALSWAWPKLRRDAAARAIYGRGKKPLSQGDRLTQPDLAKTLEAIAAHGDAGFYEGPVAEKIAKAMKAHGGYLTADDLKAYRVRDREPLRFSYRGFSVMTMPPPSMGGIAVAEIMLTLERLGASAAPVDSGLSLHFFVEASRRAYADRRYAGVDPDFVGVQTISSRISDLLSPERLATRAPAIDSDHATPSSALVPAAQAAAAESPETTHFSVVDAAGNAVSCTTTQSAGYGSKVVIPGTGVLLGNAMGAFSPRGDNETAPGKRMASSMSPTLVAQGDRTVLVLGSPGGDTIPGTVAQVLRNLVDYGMTIDEAVAHGRVHQQYLPDKVRVERENAPPRAALDELAARGHVIDKVAMPIGDANNILVDAKTGVAWAYSDTREGGTALGVDVVTPAKVADAHAP